MKKVFVKDIKEKDQVFDSFLITRKEPGISRNGKPYLNMRIMDSSGEIDARVWDDAESLSKKFEKNDVANVKGFAVAYQGSIQVNVTDVQVLREGSYSLADFLPASSKDPEEMMNQLDATVEGVKDAHLRELLSSVFTDAGIRRLFKTAPAAKSMHHPYLGGLLEHTLSLCGLAEKIVEHYSGAGINRDLLMAGALLHDIGKIWELSYKRSFEYTDEGKLLGHITMGVELIDEKMRSIAGFPRDTAVLLKHMMLSHHGQLEFGSPKRPKTLEAIILSYLDDLDAKVAAVGALIDGEPQEGSGWTPYQRIFERAIFRGGPMQGADAEDGKKPGESKTGGPKADASKAAGKVELELFK